MSAPAELVISVTADDIRHGKPHDGCRCPVARAIARLLDVRLGGDEVIVGRELILIRPGATLVDYEAPAEATRFIKSFDDGDAVEPFTFTARLVYES